MKGRGNKIGRSLYFVLWGAFTVFAVVLIVFFLIGLNSFVGKRFYGQSRDRLVSAQQQISAAIAEGSEEDALSSLAYEAGVNAYLVYEEEKSVLSLAGGKRAYAEFSGLPSALSTMYEPVYFYNEEEEELVCGEALSEGGKTCYLYLSVSTGLLDSYIVGVRWVSLVAGLFSVVLAFAASGLLALIITRPITEVTERAKQLARGDYSPGIERRSHFSEISELSEALETTRREIAKADEMQKELIANVSHDFKTPLTMIKAYASMIREISGGDPVKRNAHAAVIIEESDRLSALVEDLLDLSRLRAGVGTGEKEEFNLSEAVYTIAHRFDYLIETQGYAFEWSVEDDLFVKANRARIEQVLYNLIGNAVNYTGEDKRVRVKLFRKEGAARFEVIDSGKGIPPEEVDTIWDRYYRSSQAHKRPVGGTGLGLSIVKSILLAHEIPFGVVSEVGKGSCFWVEFPLEGSKEDKEDLT